MAKKSKHPKSKRSAGGDSAEDRFIEATLGAWEWAKSNSQTVTVATVVLALGIGAGIYYRSYQQDLNRQAAQEFEQVQQAVGAGSPESAQNELRRFLERFGDTSLAPEARILLAETQLRAGQPGEAVSTLEPVVGDLDEPVKLQAAFLLGVAYEENGDFDAAEELYLRIADEATMTFQVREALADAARIRTEQQEYAAAAELYRRILDTFDSEVSDAATQDAQQRQAARQQERSLYRLRLAEVQAAAEDEG